MSSSRPESYAEQLRAARDHVRSHSDIEPRIALILGSGLGAFADTLTDATALRYDDIPHWPRSTVDGHAGQLVIGHHKGLALAVLQGRAHLYEGYAAWQVVFPTRVLAMMGCRSLLVSNAAGAINTDFAAGDLMLIHDHINLQGCNSCAGENLDELGPRFFDMTHAYDPGYRDLARGTAEKIGVLLREGIYAGMLGPSYETPAEISMLRTLGADAVGMSTVPEVTAANHAGMKVVGISCLTNMAAGVLDQPLDHDEVMQTAERVRHHFIGLIGALVDRIAAAEGWVAEESE
jgi:purine-nucleoside phosphorylase